VSDAYPCKITKVMLG